MHPNFEKILRFAQATGDKLVVTDVEGREPIVVMSLATYAELVGFSGLKKSIESEKTSEKSEKLHAEAAHEDLGIDQLSDDFFKNEPFVAQSETLDQRKSPERPKERAFKAPKDTPGEVKAKTEPILVKKQEPEATAQEEQFYLEPIE
ncbi:hypothetical protein HYV72_02515 [Candidatus Uhrbacteria bacterium]|nr:hypothetical protein [Candidatus Uhrbacteria bacterium]